MQRHVKEKDKRSKVSFARAARVVWGEEEGNIFLLFFSKHLRNVLIRKRRPRLYLEKVKPRVRREPCFSLVSLTGYIKFYSETLLFPFFLFFIFSLNIMGVLLLTAVVGKKFCGVKFLFQPIFVFFHEYLVILECLTLVGIKKNNKIFNEIFYYSKSQIDQQFHR